MHRCPLGILALGLILVSARAQEPGPAPAPESPPPPVISPVGAEPQPEPSPVRWEGTTAVLGSVQLDSATKTVTATGWVNQIEGPIEVLACGIKGKVHESVFVLVLNPLDLQAALLLAGLKGGPPMPALGVGRPRARPWIFSSNGRPGRKPARPVPKVSYGISRRTPSCRKRRGPSRAPW